MTHTGFFKTIGICAVGMMFALFVPVMAQEIKFDYVHGTDFSKYKTYKWKKAEKARYPDQPADRILTEAIQAQLAAKGLIKTDSETADLYVMYQIAIVQDVEWSSFSNDVNFVSGSESLAGFSRPATNSSTIVRVGWLTLDFFDVSQKRYVWHSSAKKTLSDSRDPKKMEKNARKAMAKVFKNYPPN